jgi:hypothetical protein
LDFGCDGARVDTVANAFSRDGQSGGGDENGESFVADLAKVFHDRGALPLVEVLCAPDVTDAVERHGMLVLYRDWQIYSTHDFVNTDLSQDAEDFLGEVRYLLRDTAEKRGWQGALFVNISFLDVEGDPYKLKRVEHRNDQTTSTWDTQMSLPSDSDFQNRFKWNRGYSLACIVNEETGRELEGELSVSYQAFLPRVDLSLEITPTDSNGRILTSRKDLLGLADDYLLMDEMGAYLTRGSGFRFQHQDQSSLGWGGFQAALSTMPDSIVARELAAKNFENYATYVTRLIPQAEPIQAWTGATMRQVRTPKQFRAWASQFEDQLRIHARRRVESWRRHESGGFREVPAIARLHETAKVSSADRTLNDDHAR